MANPSDIFTPTLIVMKMTPKAYVRTDIKIYEVNSNSVSMSSCTDLSVMCCYPSPTISDPYSRIKATLLRCNVAIFRHHI